MAKQIIILGVSQSSGVIQATSVFWYPITSGQKTTTAGSAWSGASAAELTAIGNGSVLEEVNTYSFPPATTKAQVQTYLLNVWTARNSQIGGIGPALYNSVFYDPGSGGWSS